MGRHSLSDEEKKRRGTFREDTSAAALAAKRAEKVIVGPWLTKIPVPEMPLNEVGRARYDLLAGILFNNNKLTEATCMDCQLVALHWQGVKARIEAGKPPSSDSLKQIASITQRLRIAEDAPAIANPDHKNKFASIGTANRVLSTFRLRAASAS